MIDTYFKEHFWTFYLLVLAAAGFLLGQVVSTYAREVLRPPLSASSTGTSARAAAKVDKNRSLVPTRAFLDRNVFKADREDLAPIPDVAEPGTQNASAGLSIDGEFNPDNCEKSALSAKLVATIVSSRKGRSVAVFVNPAKKQPTAYRVKDKVQDKAEIMKIEWRRVYVSNQGRCEMFSLEEPNKKKKGARSSPIAAKGNTSAPKVKIGSTIKKLSDTEYEIPKEEIENVLGNLNVIATQARIVPSFRNGKANGFKLFSIRPGSLYSKIGIQNGDVIQKINGYDINSPDKALEIYGKLKDASSITVDLVRRGRTKTLNYGIR